MRRSSIVSVTIITVVFLIFVLPLIIALAWLSYEINYSSGSSNPKRDTFTFSNADYQYGNASPMKQFNYYGCVAKECGGDTHDYECLEKCKYKTFRKGMGAQDTKGMLCDFYTNNDRDYYRCLAQMYTGYRYQ